MNYEILLSLSLLLIFFGLLFGGVAVAIYESVKESKNIPPFQITPDPDAKFLASVHTFYLSRTCRTLCQSYHKTHEEAQEAAKKNALWFDTYGNIHGDVGIRWQVVPLSSEKAI